MLIKIRQNFFKRKNLFFADWFQNVFIRAMSKTLESKSVISNNFNKTTDSNSTRLKRTYAQSLSESEVLNQLKEDEERVKRQKQQKEEKKSAAEVRKQQKVLEQDIKRKEKEESAAKRKLAQEQKMAEAEAKKIARAEEQMKKLKAKQEKQEALLLKLASKVKVEPHQEDNSSCSICKQNVLSVKCSKCFSWYCSNCSNTSQASSISLCIKCYI